MIPWDLVITIALTTGMRRGELLNTVWGDIDFENKAIIPFVQQWLKDVADLGGSDETRLLEFPDIL